MNKFSNPLKILTILSLKVVILIIAMAIFSWLLIFPQTEGRAVKLDLINIYKDPLIIYIYISFVPFFIALYQAFKLLNLIEKDKLFSQKALRAVRYMKYCGITLTGFILIAVIYLFITQRNKDDIAGGVMIGIFIIFASLITVVATNLFEKTIRKVITKQ